jgi:glutamyl-tRNA reductase
VLILLLAFYPIPPIAFMLDGYHILTITHRDAPLTTIGRALAPEADDLHLLQKLKQQFDWEELFYLPTCNRALYFFYTQNIVKEAVKEGFLRALRPDLTLEALAETASKMRLLHGAAAISHFMEVAASMDSLVVGEREIIRQIRQAYDRCRHAGLTGDHLRLLVRSTIETAKEVYSRTGIGEKALSVVALAFGEMLKTSLRPQSRILLVGAGQTNALFAKFLAKRGFRHVTVFNRSLSKAQALADSLGGRAFPLDELRHFSEGFDALVVCTGATEAVISPEIYQQLLAGETGSKVVVDLSVPNDVDARTVRAFPMQYIEIESLRDVATENLAHRERECARAGAIVQARVLAFRDLWHERQVERSLAHIPDEVRAVKERAVNEVFGKEFAQLEPAAQRLMLEMLGYMEKKCVAIPMKAAKAIALRAQKRHSAEIREAV